MLHPISAISTGNDVRLLLEIRWGRQALEHLIEIYLSPNGDHLWEVASTAPGGDGYAEALGVAKKLLLELEQTSGGGRGGGGGSSKAGMRRRSVNTSWQL